MRGTGPFDTTPIWEDSEGDEGGFGMGVGLCGWGDGVGGEGIRGGGLGAGLVPPLPPPGDPVPLLIGGGGLPGNSSETKKKPKINITSHSVLLSFFVIFFFFLWQPFKIGQVKKQSLLSTIFFFSIYFQIFPLL